MKKLMVAAAVALSAMVGFSVESANIVGYQTLTIKPGWNMLAVNFKDVNNTDGILLNDLFLGTGDEATCPFHADGNVNTADNIQIFNADTQGYTTYFLYYTTKTTSSLVARKYRWNEGNAVTTKRIHNGDSMWFLSRSASDVQMNISGEVELAAVSNITIKTGWNMIGSFFPDGWKVNDDATGYTQEFWEHSGAHADGNVNTADNIQVFNAATQGYTTYFLYYTTKTTSSLVARKYRWNVGNSAVEGSVMEPGQGAWYLHRGSGFTLPIKNQTGLAE